MDGRDEREEGGMEYSSKWVDVIGQQYSHADVNCALVVFNCLFEREEHNMLATQSLIFHTHHDNSPPTGILIGCSPYSTNMYNDYKVN